MADWVMGVLEAASYAGIVFLMFIENVFPPIPSEVIMPLAGYMANQGRLGFAGIVVAGTAGSVLGALPLYYLGYSVSEKDLGALCEKYGRWFAVSADDIRRAREWFNRHGRLAVFLCRLVPGLRSLISIPAGIDRMPMPAFLFYTALGAAIWTAALAYVGYYLGANFEQVGEYLNPVSWVVLGVIVALYIYRVVRRKGSGRTPT